MANDTRTPAQHGSAIRPARLCLQRSHLRQRHQIAPTNQDDQYESSNDILCCNLELPGN
jgi:hypothetical protein